MLSIEWDKNKARKNLTNHDVSFKRAWLRVRSPQFTNQRKMTKSVNQKTVFPLLLYAVALLLLRGSVVRAAEFAPTPLGSWVTYRFTGLNEKSGIPRFARFMRVRADMPPDNKR